MGRKTVTKHVSRTRTLVSAAAKAVKAAFLYPGVRQDHKGRLYQVGIAGGKEVMVPYKEVLPGSPLNRSYAREIAYIRYGSGGRGA